jgi:hypothetical protein
MDSQSSQKPLFPVVPFKLQRNMDYHTRRTAVHAEDLLYPLTSRRESSRASNPLRRTLDDSVNLVEEPLSSARREESSRFLVEGLTESKAVASAIRALQTRIRTLENENKVLKGTIAELEARADHDRESWKRRVMHEITLSKDRESELIARFQQLDAKLKAETKRIKQTETAFKDSEAELAVKLQQALADNSVLTTQVKRLESNCEEVVNERKALEERCEAQEAEIQTLRQHYMFTDAPADPPTFSPAMEDSQEVSVRPAPIKTDSLLEDIRREIQQAREAASRPRSLSASTQDYQHPERSLHQSVESALHRSASFQTLHSERLSVPLRKGSHADPSRLVSAPSPPLVFNPGRTAEVPKVSFCLQPSSRRGPVRVTNRYLPA